MKLQPSSSRLGITFA